MSLLRTRPSPPELSERLSLADYLQQASFSFAGSTYGLPATTWSSWQDHERVPPTLAGYARAAYGACGPVFACVLARQLVFAEARFQFQRSADGRPGDLFGTPELGILEQPWPGGTTGELLARMEQDASIAGNSFWVRRGDRLARLQPDRVSIVVGVAGGDSRTPSPSSVDSEVLGYVYEQPDGETAAFVVDEVAHYSPIPDPLASYRGMSWLTPILREVHADLATTEHRVKFFEDGAVPPYVITTKDRIGDDAAERIREAWDARVAAGANPHHSAIVLGNGMDVSPVGTTMKDAELKAVQGAGETRIAAAAGVPPVIAGFSEGLASATYSNYAQARRRFADGTLRPLWRMAADSLAVLLDVPDRARLVVDSRYISFLREDEGDQADILTKQAASMRQLIDAGYDPDAVTKAVTAGDLRQLDGRHTGRPSVQLQSGDAA